MSNHLAVFSPSGKRGRFVSGTSLLQAARSLGVDLDSVCGGRGICGRCQIMVGEGEQAKLGITSRAAHVSAAGEVEARFEAKRGALKVGRRLGCQALLCGDVVVEVPEDSQVHRQVVRKAASERAVSVDPVVMLHAVQVREADMHEPSSDGLRLLEALETQWRLKGLNLPLAVLTGLQKTLRLDGHLVTAAVRHGSEIVAVYPGVQTRLAGVAMDIGSTTIAAHLCDLATGEVLASAGVMNPQIRFGEDLMSRVSYVMLNDNGAHELTSAIREGLDALIGTVAADSGVARSEIVEVTIVGNPVMHHLFFGLDPTELGGAPFALAWDGPLDVPAAKLGLQIAPGAYVHALPCIAGHVGADAAAVVLAEGPHLSDEMVLIVDVGTNAEIMLGNAARLMACSSPTGPAFEGAQLTAGQRAAPGAIERLRIDRDTFEPRYKVIGCDIWSDEAGFAEATVKTGVTGICGSGIIETLAEMYLSGLLLADGGINGTLAERTPRIRDEYRSFTYLIRESVDGGPRIAITQHDVRAIQLAKAALHAGCKLLMSRMGVSEVTKVKLAGAFGNHIDPAHALVLGLIPDCEVSHVEAVGNAAGHGARIALVNKAARAEIAALARRIEKIETAIEPEFQAEFVAAMAFPHAVDGYPKLSLTVPLPARVIGQKTRRRADQSVAVTPPST
ncbi:MAG: ASKHA domain-containing protein [Bosea sp. (in: a-proteobacteria)]